LRDFSQYRNPLHVNTLVKKLHRIYPGGTLKIMEVCGTHTMAIARYGLRSLMPQGLCLISGPGCPVCVTPTSIINAAISLSAVPNTAILTFGDMMRVPGTEGTLELCKAKGADVRVLYSSLDMLENAKKERKKHFVFISVGFETTTPGIALSILQAEKMGLENVSFLVANRLVIPALHALCSAEHIQIDGFLCPGHVSVIIGWGAYREIAERHNIPCVVAGFEPADILMAVDELIERIANKTSGVGNAYERVVTEEGNKKALEVMEMVFRPAAAEWRGIGVIPDSGLILRPEYAHFDALTRFKVPLVTQKEPAGCRCGDVLKGIIVPPECALFGKICTPESPVGPCMVSSEGSCAAYYKYGAGE
jgi:hydrogenase expression/formation protein HypD